MSEGNKIQEQQEPKGQQPEVTPTEDMAVKGRFSRFNSPFLQLIMPLLTTRYVWLAIEDINPKNFLMKPDPAKLPGTNLPDPKFKPWVKPKAFDYVRRNFAALGMGASVLGAIGFYSKRTYEDIKTLYSEAVGYEFNKKPEDVTWSDISRSENKALQITRDAFVKRTAARALAGSAFLMPWQALRDHPHAKPKYDANANAGVGAMGVYLSVYEGFLRKPSFFDMEQKMVGVSVKPDDMHAHEMVKAKDVQSLLMIQRRHLDENFKPPVYASEEGQHYAAVSRRVADLINQTCGNSVKHEYADMTIGKFNYLVGFGLLDSFPSSLGFVELANRAPGMDKVKQVAAEIKNGRTPAEAFKEQGIDLDKLVRSEMANAPSAKPDAPIGKFTSMVPQAKDRIPQAARSAQDFAALAASGQYLNQ